MSDQIPGAPVDAPPDAPPAAPPAPPMLPGPPIDVVLGDLLGAVDQAAVKSKGSSDVREVKEFAGAALNFAQAYAILHPDIVAPQGVVPEAIARTTPPRPAPAPAQPKVKTGGDS